MSKYQKIKGRLTPQEFKQYVVDCLQRLDDHDTSQVAQKQLHDIADHLELDTLPLFVETLTAYPAGSSSLSSKSANLPMSSSSSSSYSNSSSIGGGGGNFSNNSNNNNNNSSFSNSLYAADRSQPQMQSVTSGAVSGLASTLSFGQSDFKTVSARAQTLRILGLLCSLYRFDMSAHVSRMQMYVVRRFRDSEKEVQDACATVFGHIVKYVLSEDEPITQLVKPLFAMLNEKNREAQVTASLSLVRVLENCSRSRLYSASGMSPAASLMNSSTSSQLSASNEVVKMGQALLRFYSNPLCLAKPNILDIVSSLIKCEGPSTAAAQVVFQSNIWNAVTTQAIKDQKDWFHRRAAAQFLHTVISAATDIAVSSENPADFVQLATQKKDEMRAVLEDARFDKIKPVREIAQQAFEMLQGIPDPILRSHLWSTVSDSDCKDGGATEALTRSLNKSMIKTIKASPAKQAFKTRSFQATAGMGSFSDNQGPGGYDEQSGPDATAFDMAQAQQAQTKASPSSLSSVNVVSELEKIARQQEALVQLLESLSVTTKNAFRGFEDRLQRLEGRVEQMSQSQTECAAGSPGNPDEDQVVTGSRSLSFHAKAATTSGTSAAAAGNSKNIVEDQGGAWRKSQALWTQGQYSEAYRVLLDGDDPLQLVRMMGRTGPVLDVLDAYVRTDLVERWVDFLERGVFLDNILAWIHQSLQLEDGQMIAGLPLDLSSRLSEALRSVSAHASPHGIKAATLLMSLNNILNANADY
eukprot:ANDGO_01636.mRNA.1 Microtubule-associated protein TORTIFOLIA1